MKKFVSKLNLGLRAVMELGIVVGLGYWGYRVGGTAWAKVALATGMPIVVFGFWGLVDFRSAGRWAELLRLVQELVISLLAAGAVYWAGLPVAGFLLATVSVVYHALVYLIGERLLKSSNAPDPQSKR